MRRAESLALLCLGGLLSVAAVSAAPSPDLPLRDEPAVFGGGTAAQPIGGPADAEPATANPLWAVPLNSLSATRERPLFLPSRRAPPPAVTAVAPSPTKPILAPVAAEPERPEFSLVGVISSETDGIAIFSHDTNRDVFRLRTGEAYNGWILRSVRGREAVLEKNRQSAVLEIPSPSTK